MKNYLNYYVCKSLGGIIYSDFIFEIVRQGFGRFKQFYLVADTDGSLYKKGEHKKIPHSTCFKNFSTIL